MGDTPLATASFAVVVLALTARSGRQWQHKRNDILLPIGLLVSRHRLCANGWAAT
jgi:hypothetical protein